MMSPFEALSPSLALSRLPVFFSLSFCVCTLCACLPVGLSVCDTSTCKGLDPSGHQPFHRNGKSQTNWAIKPGALVSALPTIFI